MAGTPKGRALGMAIRKARQDSGLTLRDVADRIGRHSGEISRWETGERPLTPERAAQLLTAMGINGDHFDAIMALAHDTAVPSAWVATTLPERQQQMSALIDFERTARRITAVAPLLVPGPLQTQGYIRAIMTAGDGVPTNEVATRVAVRMGRREALTRADPVSYAALIGEAALHQIIGDASIMIDQLHHLQQMHQRPNIDLRVIPYNSGWNTALEGAFYIIEPEYSTPIIHLENRRSMFFLHEQDDVKAYRTAVQELLPVTLSPEESARAIAAAIKRLEKSG